MHKIQLSYWLHLASSSKSMKKKALRHCILPSSSWLQVWCSVKGSSGCHSIGNLTVHLVLNQRDNARVFIPERWLYLSSLSDSPSIVNLCVSFCLVATTLDTWSKSCLTPSCRRKKLTSLRFFIYFSPLSMMWNTWWRAVKTWRHAHSLYLKCVYLFLESSCCWKTSSWSYKRVGIPKAYRRFSESRESTVFSDGCVMFRVACRR